MDENQARQEAIKNEISRLLTELSQLRNPDDKPFIVGWVAAYEWTSVRLEQDDRYGMGVASPTQQAKATDVGLFTLATRFNEET